MADGPVATAQAMVASPQSYVAEMPKEAPVRILDERGHLRTLEEIEKDLIQLAIGVYSGHMSEVARRLGIGRSTLYRKVREQGIDGIGPDPEGDMDAEAA
jgi:DNA-binding NtrC family response regulator